MRLEVKKATEAEPEPVMTLELVQEGGGVGVYAHLPNEAPIRVGQFRVKSGKVFVSRWVVPPQYFHIDKRGLIDLVP